LLLKSWGKGIDPAAEDVTNVLLPRLPSNNKKVGWFLREISPPITELCVGAFEPIHRGMTEMCSDITSRDFSEAKKGFCEKICGVEDQH
jgi:hypothetical protein